MSERPATCTQVADDLLAAAMGEASPHAVQRVGRHLEICGTCRREFEGYRALDETVAAMRTARDPNGHLAQSRAQLDARLADLRSRLLAYRIFPSPLGHMLIARTELGISLIEYLEQGTTLRASRLYHESAVEIVEGGGELEGVYRELLEYLSGQRTRLDWPLDMRLAKSEFHRMVLHATAAVPYGAVIPYAGIAHGIGKAAAVRAVAQALRWNPLPIVIPCHRVIGTSGSLTGYAGNRIGLKRRLLALEGVPIAKHAGDVSIAPREMYVLYPGDREYCLPSCPSLDTRPPAPLTRFSSRERAEAAGFDPCTTCRPDLHPLSR